MEIVEEHPLQACVILLATWNVSRFRFIVSDSKNLTDLIDALNKCKPLLEKLKGLKFKSVDFSEIGETVKQIYSIFSKVKGVEYTGTSKIMHLLNNELFDPVDLIVKTFILNVIEPGIFSPFPDNR